MAVLGAMASSRRGGRIREGYQNSISHMLIHLSHRTCIAMVANRHEDKWLLIFLRKLYMFTFLKFFNLFYTLMYGCRHGFCSCTVC